VLKELNPKTEMMELKVRFSPVPHRIRGLANNIIKDLRDALDQATFAATLHITGSARKRSAHFPFGSSPDDLDTAITRNQCKDIPRELYSILKGFEPYPTGDGYSGGNNFLRLLGKISGPHKHRITLAPAVNMAKSEIRDFELYSGKGGIVIFPDAGLTKNNETVILSLGRESKAKLNVTVAAYVAFSDTKMKGIEVGTFLRECCATVGYIVQEIQTQALKFTPRSG
jgi:hypothetical protein